MLKEIVISVQAFFRAHRFIQTHRLWKWIILPGIFYTLMFLVGGYLFWQTSTHATAFILAKSGISSWLNKVHADWINVLLVISQIFIHFLLLLFYFSFFKYLYLIVCSPVFAYLSEKTNALLTGKEIEFSFSQFVKDILRGIHITIRNMFWQLVYTIALLMMSFIPLIGWVSPVILFFLDCYYMGFSMLDYSHEREQISTQKSIYIIGHHKGLAIGNGILFYGMHLLPIIGWILAPSYAVIAATLTLHEAKAQKIIQY